MTNLIYDILKEIELLHYWNELSKYRTNEFIDIQTNQIIEEIFDKNLNFMLEIDRNKFRQALVNYIHHRELQLEMDQKCDLTDNTTTNNQQIQPTYNKLIKQHINDKNSLNNSTKYETNTNIINPKKMKLSNNVITTKKQNTHSKNDDITCIHHISYKAYGPNNFIPNYTKRYCIESTGEEIHGVPDDNNTNATRTTDQSSSNLIYPTTYDSLTNFTYNRGYYHPYYMRQNRYYSHNRMYSEPSKHHPNGYNNPELYVYNTNINNNGAISNIPSVSRGNHQPHHYYHPMSISQTDYTNSECNPNNSYKPQTITMEQPNNRYHVFEGSKAMEESPLHKYNLLDPPIFKYHSICIPSRIPFLIRLDSLDEDRVNMIKNASIIFGRSDNRRKSPSLNLNEMLMNEVAFQLCLRDPLYLISRQKLIMESREIIRESGHRFQEDINILPFEESNNCLPTQSQSNNNNNNNNNNNTDNKSSTNTTNTQTNNDAKTISEVRDTPIMPSNNKTEVDPFFIQDDSSSIQCRNLMAKYCYDDYDTIYYYKIHKKWPQNADSSRKAYLRRKSKKFKVIDNHLYSISTSSERLRLWLRDVDAVIEHAPRFHYKESGDHFTRNETISRMLRYCYSNDIPNGVTEFIKSCTICMEREWKENSNGSTKPSVRTQSALVSHQLLSPKTNMDNHYDCDKSVAINSISGKPPSINTNNDHCISYTNGINGDNDHSKRRRPKYLTDNINKTCANSKLPYNNKEKCSTDKSDSLLDCNDIDSTKPSYDDVEIGSNSPVDQTIDGTISKIILNKQTD